MQSFSSPSPMARQMRAPSTAVLSSPTRPWNARIMGTTSSETCRKTWKNTSWLQDLSHPTRKLTNWSNWISMDFLRGCLFYHPIAGANNDIRTYSNILSGNQTGNGIPYIYRLFFNQTPHLYVCVYIYTHTYIYIYRISVVTLDYQRVYWNHEPGSIIFWRRVRHIDQLFE